MDTQTVAAYLTNAGMDVIAVDVFTKTIKFADFNEFYRFGMESGFFTHILAQFDSKQIAGFGRLENIFPLEDQYKASVVLARKP